MPHLDDSIDTIFGYLRPKRNPRGAIRHPLLREAMSFSRRPGLSLCSTREPMLAGPPWPYLGGETLSQTVLLIGTRKGCFVLESDGDRRDWALRGPYCEGWPVYHAVLERSSGAIYAAAASEWHGSAVWRSADLGETWTLSSEGLAHADESKKLSKVSTLAASPGRVLVGVEAPGIFASRDEGATWSDSRRSPASPAASSGTTRRTSRPGISACPR